MTVVTSLTEHKRFSHPSFETSVRNGNYRQLELVDEPLEMVETTRDVFYPSTTEPAILQGLRNGRIVERDGVFLNTSAARNVDQARYSFTVQSFKPRNQRLAKLETIAMLLIGIALYGTVALALLAVIQANI